jgi:hypothetical protein
MCPPNTEWPAKRHEHKFVSVLTQVRPICVSCAGARQAGIWAGFSKQHEHKDPFVSLSWLLSELDSQNKILIPELQHHGNHIWRKNTVTTVIPSGWYNAVVSTANSLEFGTAALRRRRSAKFINCQEMSTINHCPKKTIGSNERG